MIFIYKTNQRTNLQNKKIKKTYYCFPVEQLYLDQYLYLNNILLPS